MSTTRIIPGSGLLGRTSSALWWVDSDIPLTDELVNFETAGFKNLAAHVLDSDFDAASFAVIDLTHKAVFSFGNVIVTTNDSTLDASTSSTWIERSLVSCEHVAINPGAGTADASTDLVAGVVRGGGLVCLLYTSPSPRD